jgi:bifunctional non-homologous end joining protein LigD
MPQVVDLMMAVLAAHIPEPDDRHGFEFKWDGVRAAIFVDGPNVRLQTRNHNDVTVRYPELHAIGSALGGRRAILDGEIVAMDERGRPSFEQLQRRMGLSVESEVRQAMAAVPVVYMAFDVIYLDDGLVTGETYVRRRELLEGLGLDAQHWQTPPWQAGGGAALLQTSLERGLEGVMAKRLDSRYELGARSGAWLKVKNRLRQELVIGGWMDGQGRLQGLPGSLLVGYFEDGRFVYAGKVGTGFTAATLARLADLMRPLERPTSPFEAGRPPKGAHFVEPRLVAEFEFAEWTKAGELRSPSFKGLREDKDARDVVREVPRDG